MSEADTAATAAVTIEEMPVDVRFEAGRLTTTVGELERLQPGFTFELDTPLGESTIDITANGALIARGELVSIGGELGVRITAVGRRFEPAG